MKVLHFFKTYYPDTFGGVEQVIYQLAEGGRRYGVESEVLFLSPRGSASGEVYGGHITHRSKQDLNLASTGFSFSVFRDFADLARQADVVHYHFPWPFMDLVHFAVRLNKPSVVSYHSDIVKQKTLLRLYQPLMHKFLDSVGHIVAASPNYVKTSPILHRYADKVSVIPYGLDKASYSSPDASTFAKWRAMLGERFFLFVGAFRYYKGLHTLLDAAKGSGYPIVLVGDGPIRKELEDQAARLGLGNIHFLGALPDEDKAALLQLCYAMVFPSHLRSEAFGISLLEGAMHGKPMISCEIGTGTTYINIDQQTGFAVPPEDSAAMRNAMDTLWHQPELAEKMGGEAEQRYFQLFTAEKMVQQYANLYQSLH